MTVGFSFGDTELFRLRKYYREWIGSTLSTIYAQSLSKDGPMILRFKDCVDPIAIEDEGRLPCSHLQRIGRVSYCPGKVACLYVEIRHMIQIWWACYKETPGDIEPWLVGLDNIIENWDRQQVTGGVAIGYWLIDQETGK